MIRDKVVFFGWIWYMLSLMFNQLNQIISILNENISLNSLQNLKRNI